MATVPYYQLAIAQMDIMMTEKQYALNVNSHVSIVLEKAV